MKKIICVLLVVMMLMGTAFAEEEFTLHNGTKFGMTSEEVIEIERENGFDYGHWVSDDKGYKEYDYSWLHDKNGHTIAGQEKASITYFFRDSDDALFEAKYVFSSTNLNRHTTEWVHQ